MSKDIYNNMYIMGFILWGEERRIFSMLDDELSIYMDLIIKTLKSVLFHFSQ
jgi:hypothetical protein